MVNGLVTQRRGGGRRSARGKAKASAGSSYEEPKRASGPEADPVSDPESAPQALAPAGGLSIQQALGVIIGMAGFLITARALADNSLLTHLATGRLILDQGAVPSVDPYSSTASGQPWTVQSWLPSLIYASLDRFGSPVLIRLLNGFFGLGLTLGLWRLSRPAKQLIPRVLLTLLPVLIGSVFWSSRPLLFGLAAMLMALIVWSEDRPGWILIPTLYIWVNSHGSFPLIFVFLGGAALGRLLDDRRFPRHEANLAMWAGVGCAVAMVNPVGPQLLTFPFRLLDRREALEGVVEWSPPGFSHWTEYAFLLYLGMIIVAAKRGARWLHLVPAAGFIVCGFLAIRNFNMAGLVAVAALAPYFSGLIGAEAGEERGRLARLVAVVGASGLLAAVVAVVATPAFALDPYPEDEVESLHDRGLIGDPSIRVLHREAVGNYLSLRYGDDASNFIDDRFDFYPLDVVQDHRHLVSGVAVGEIIERREPDVILWEAEDEVASWVRRSDDWLVASEDDDWLIACRRSSSHFANCAES